MPGERKRRDINWAGETPKSQLDCECRTRRQLCAGVFSFVLTQQQKQEKHCHILAKRFSRQVYLHKNGQFKVRQTLRIIMAATAALFKD